MQNKAVHQALVLRLDMKQIWGFPKIGDPKIVP